MDWAKNLQKIFLDGRKTTSESSVIEVYRKKKKKSNKNNTFVFALFTNEESFRQCW